MSLFKITLNIVAENKPKYSIIIKIFLLLKPGCNKHLHLCHICAALLNINTISSAFSGYKNEKRTCNCCKCNEDVNNKK